MRVLNEKFLVGVVLMGFASAGLFGCGPSDAGGTGSGGSAGTGSGSGGSAGTTGAAGAGAQGSAGTTGAGGSSAGNTGGSTAGTVGSAGAAGTSAGGASGSAGAAGNGGTAGANGGRGGNSGTAGANGGRGGNGGTAGANGGRGGSGGSAGASGGRGGAGASGGGGRGGTTGTGGTSSGGASGTAGAGGMCVKDQIQPSEVVFIGDSFIALGNNIPTALEADARAAGSLGQNEHYRNNAVSGTLLGNGQIPGQYMSAVTASAVKVVLMDGGGNDCLQANNAAPAYTAAMTLFQNMAQRNTEHVIYFFYPDPLGSYATGTLKPCLDGLRPMMKALCDGLTAPKCHFIDLRAGWNSSHTTDGIHTTAAGGKFVADKVWEVMQQSCIAQ